MNNNKPRMYWLKRIHSVVLAEAKIDYIRPSITDEESFITSFCRLVLRKNDGEDIVHWAAEYKESNPEVVDMTAKIMAVGVTDIDINAKSEAILKTDKNIIQAVKANKNLYQMFKYLYEAVVSANSIDLSDKESESTGEEITGDNEETELPDLSAEGEGEEDTTALRNEIERASEEGSETREEPTEMGGRERIADNLIRDEKQLRDIFRPIEETYIAAMNLNEATPAPTPTSAPTPAPATTPVDVDAWVLDIVKKAKQYSDEGGNKMDFIKLVRENLITKTPKINQKTIENTLEIVAMLFDRAKSFTVGIQPSMIKPLTNDVKRKIAEQKDNVYFGLDTVSNLIDVAKKEGGLGLAQRAIKSGTNKLAKRIQGKSYGKVGGLADLTPITASTEHTLNDEMRMINEALRNEKVNLNEEDVEEGTVKTVLPDTYGSLLKEAGLSKKDVEPRVTPKSINKYQESNVDLDMDENEWYNSLTAKEDEHPGEDTIPTWNKGKETDTDGATTGKDDAKPKRRIMTQLSDACVVFKEVCRQDPDFVSSAVSINNNDLSFTAVVTTHGDQKSLSKCADKFLTMIGVKDGEYEIEEFETDDADTRLFHIYFSNILAKNSHRELSVPAKKSLSKKRQVTPSGNYYKSDEVKKESTESFTKKLMREFKDWF
jgi:hypothetical protein